MEGERPFYKLRKMKDVPPLPSISVHHLHRALDRLFLAEKDSTQANGQPLDSLQTDKGAAIYGVPESFSEVKAILELTNESTHSYN
jgi:hypothetical protein